MRLSKQRKIVIETLYREYHGLMTLGGKNDVEWLRDRFNLAKRQAEGLIEFVRCNGDRLPSYHYYAKCMNDISDIWRYYYDYN